jgi:multidrug resistance protein, MATE family
MYKTTTTKEKINLLIKLLVPILVTQCGMYGMSFFDTVMSGHASANDLAGAAIGSNIWMPIFTGLSGILMGLTPILSHHIGAKDYERIPYKLFQAIYLAVTMALVILLLGYFLLNPILTAMHLTPLVNHIAKNYLLALSFGMIPLFTFNALRGFIDAHGQTRLSMGITLIALPINVFFNYLFIFGHFGFPRLGGVGAGVATAITYWIITGIAFVVIAKGKAFEAYQPLKSWPLPSPRDWKEQLKIGLPIGFSIFFETSIFAVSTLLMSQYSTLVVAAHQAALNFASFLYMMPLSVSMAMTIAVGFESGAKRFKDAKIYSQLGLKIAVLFALGFAILLFLFNHSVATLYTTNQAVITMTSHFLMYAIFFQFSDAVQAPIQGALRGYKDVNITFIMTLISFWVVGLPTGMLLAHFTTLGPYGYWLGLIIGLAVGAVTLFFRLINVQKHFRQADAS